MNKESIRLNEFQLNLLIEHLLSIDLKNKFVKLKEGGPDLNNGYVTNVFSISITKEDKEKIVNELADTFSEKGLNSDSEPNDFGLSIEELIDKFSPYK